MHLSPTSKLGYLSFKIKIHCPSSVKSRDTNGIPCGHHSGALPLFRQMDLVHSDLRNMRVIMCFSNERPRTH